jgi:hypothetical protein
MELPKSDQSTQIPAALFDPNPYRRKPDSCRTWSTFQPPPLHQRTLEVYQRHRTFHIHKR